MDLSFHFNLRLILLAMGGLFIVAIFVDGLRRKRKRKQRLAPDFSITDVEQTEYSDDLEQTDDSFAQLYKSEDQRQAATGHSSFENAKQVNASPHAAHYSDEELDDEEDLQYPDISAASNDEHSEHTGEASLIADELATLRKVDEERSPTLNELEKTARSRKQLLSSIDKQRKRLNNLLNTKSIQSNVDNIMLEDLEMSIPKANDSPILMVYSMASADNEYAGYQLLQSLLSAGMRYGAMNIFHRYRELNGKGPILFSLARADEPGTLDIQKMGQIRCSGLSLFLQLRPEVDNVLHFDLMLETAHQISQDLEGKLLDDRRASFTQDSYKYYRSVIKQFETELSQGALSSSEL